MFENKMLQKIQIGLQAFISWALGFVFTIFPFWVLIVIMCLFDRHIGIKVAQMKKIPLQKNGWRRTIDKLGMHTGWILVMGLFQFVFKDEIPQNVNLARIIAGMIAFSEFDSVVFNYSEFTGRDYRKLLLSRIPFVGGYIAEKLPREKSRLLSFRNIPKTESSNENQDKNPDNSTL